MRDTKRLDNMLNEFVERGLPGCGLQVTKGAETIYEEDSLFNLFKEERQAWDDFLTKGKRDMTRKFFKFAKTHPRKGKNVRRIAFLYCRFGR